MRGCDSNQVTNEKRVEQLRAMEERYPGSIKRALECLQALDQEELEGFTKDCPEGVGAIVEAL